MRRNKIELLILGTFLVTIPITTFAYVDNNEYGFLVVNTNTWIKMNPETIPPGRTDSPLVYDSGSDMIILFGGENGPNNPMRNDTWAYSYETDSWTNMSPILAPSVRFGHGFTYDSESDRVIMFSGFNQSDTQGKHINHQETWEYDYNQNLWTNLNPSSMPAPRCYGTMVYDEESDRTILFGGILNGNILTADTWAYDYNTNTWENMNPSSHPSIRFWPIMAYNTEADRIILYGGLAAGATILTDTWAYDYNTNTWTNLSPINHPTESSGALIYDTKNNVCLLFGGIYSNDILSSITWIYNYTSNYWCWIDSSNELLKRCRAPLAYDINSNRTIMFGGMPGGTDFDNIYNDTWSFEFQGQCITPTTTTSTTTTANGTPSPLPLLPMLYGLMLIVILTILRRSHNN